MNFYLKSWLPGIVQILVGLNNENQESHIGVNAKDQSSKGARLESSYTFTNAYTERAMLSSNYNFRLDLHQTSDCNCIHQTSDNTSHYQSLDFTELFSPLA